MTEFTELYKRLSNSELLKIIAESEKYNPIAIETAKKEIDSRNLSVQELNEVNINLNKQEEKKKNDIEKRKRQEEKIKKTASTLFDTINPIQNGIQTPEKIIRLTTLIFTGVAVYRIFNEFGMLKYMFTRRFGKWDLSLVEYFFPLILLPIAVFLFWKRKKIGWTLLSIYLTYSSITAIGLFFINLERYLTGSPSLIHFRPTTPPITYIMALIFFSATLWMICKKEVRIVYNIKAKTMFLIIGLTIAVNLIFIYSVFQL